MFALKKTTPTGGDETAGYDVELEKDYTLKEFVEAILTSNMEHGNIRVGDNCFGYGYGVLRGEIPQNLLDRKVVNATSVGGWSLMNYYVSIDDPLETNHELADR